MHKDILVAEYFGDLLVNDVLLVELRPSKPCTTRPMGARCNAPIYLKATGLRLCLLLSFGELRLEIKRVAHGL